MAEDKDDDQAFVAKWLHDQQQWQRTLLTYLDSIAKDENFLVHLGNAMRGSLLAGKPYPTPSTAAASDSSSDPRLDEILFALRKIEGQLHDVSMTLAEIAKRGKPSAAPPRAAKRRGKK